MRSLGQPVRGRRPVLALCALLAAGCGCQGEPELIYDGPPDLPPIDTDLPPIDTAPPPPCAVPEVEPNDVVTQATPLQMEAVGCGEFEAPGDVDWYSFRLEEEGWIQVRADAKPLGSIADVHLLVQGFDGTSADRLDNEGSTDATLVFPAMDQGYYVRLSEQNNQGDGGRYFYEILATVTKPPVDWTRHEVEPNNGHASAEVVYDGDAIFGTMGSLDSDWYRLSIPPGRHTATFSIQAYAHGSPGDFSLILSDSQQNALPLGCNNCVVTGPPSGFARDPVLIWESVGNEEVFLRVFEAAGRSGGAVWYVLQVDLEGP